MGASVPRKPYLTDECVQRPAKSKSRPNKAVMTSKSAQRCFEDALRSDEPPVKGATKSKPRKKTKRKAPKIDSAAEVELHRADALAHHEQFGDAVLQEEDPVDTVVRNICRA